MEYYSLFLVLTVILLIIFIVFLSNHKDAEMYSTKERAGRKGEIFVSNELKKHLSEDDFILTNIEISYDGKRAEFDIIVINKYGVFIIEVKNYSGIIIGSEDSFEWKKYKRTNSGNVYEKTIGNPIKQVKRQIFILAKYLKCYGINVWIEGYVYLINDNSSTESEYIISSIDKLSSKIHSYNRNRLTKNDIDNIVRLLS